MTVLRVVLAEDQAMVLGAIKALLESEHDIRVVACARCGAEAIALTEQLCPDVLVMDVEMPGMSGLDAADELRRRASTTRIVILTTFGRPGYFKRALGIGVSGYLLKDSEPESLASAIRRAAAGLRAIDPELAHEATHWMNDPLTERERRVLRAASSGRTIAEIAHLLNLSEGTVRNYVSDAMAKLGASTRMQAAQIARSMGWL